MRNSFLKTLWWCHIQLEMKYYWRFGDHFDVSNIIIWNWELENGLPVLWIFSEQKYCNLKWGTIMAEHLVAYFFFCIFVWIQHWNLSRCSSEWYFLMSIFGLFWWKWYCNLKWGNIWYFLGIFDKIFSFL